MFRASQLALRWVPLLCWSTRLVAGEETCSAEQNPPPDSKPRWRGTSYGEAPEGMYGGELVALQFQAAGYDNPVVTDDWDVLFSYEPMPLGQHLPELPGLRSRVVNHCLYFLAAGQKCTFASHVQRVEEAFGRGEGQSRHLRSYYLGEPLQFEAWLSAITADPLKHWVVKTCSGGNSEEVKILKAADTEAAMALRETQAVAQEYLDNPLRLWDGGKFHLRAYLLVTRWAPAAAFLYDEGTVLRSKLPYDPKKPSDAHLFSRYSDTVEILSFGYLWKELGLERTAEVKRRIREVLGEIFGVSEALEQSFGPFKRKGDYSCFDLFGLDIMLDEEYQPHILEVNQGPNLWADHLAILHPIKGLLVKQIATYARERSDAPLDISVLEEEDIENVTLITFMRVM